MAASTTRSMERCALATQPKQLNADTRMRRRKQQCRLRTSNKGVAELLKNKDCLNFVKGVIHQVSKSTKNPFISDDPQEILRGVLIDFSQQYTNDGKPVAGRAYPRDIEYGIGSLGISPLVGTGILPQAAAYHYAETVLHELIHFAGRGGNYSDRQLVRAIGEMGAVPKQYKKWFESFSGDPDENSGFFDAVLQFYCPRKD